MPKHSEYWEWIPTGRIRLSVRRIRIWPFIDYQAVVIEAEETALITVPPSATTVGVDDIDYQYDATRWVLVEDPSKLPASVFIAIREAHLHDNDY